MKVLVIGCGRVGSAIALQLADEGWEVSVIDEKEEALTRLGEGWRGTFVVGHGMDLERLARRGSRTQTPRSWRRTATTRTSSSPRSQSSGSTSGCVVVRILDPARASSTPARACGSICPTQTAIDELTDRVRTCDASPPPWR